uniref:Uncharacterized protein n=1 Tax=Capra hircus TaxID=9925 RepID=A0A8C2PMJ0_CAPHI
MLRVGEQLSIFWIIKVSVEENAQDFCFTKDFINIQIQLSCWTDGVLRYHQIMKQASDKDELGRNVGSLK